MPLAGAPLLGLDPDQDPLRRHHPAQGVDARVGEHLVEEVPERAALQGVERRVADPGLAIREGLPVLALGIGPGEARRVALLGAE